MKCSIFATSLSLPITNAFQSEQPSIIFFIQFNPKTQIEPATTQTQKCIDMDNL